MKLAKCTRHRAGLRCSTKIAPASNELDEPRTLCYRAAGRTNAFEESVPRGVAVPNINRNQKVL